MINWQFESFWCHRRNNLPLAPWCSEGVNFYHMDEHFIPREYFTHTAWSWEIQFKEILSHLGRTLDWIKHSLCSPMWCKLVHCILLVYLPRSTRNSNVYYQFNYIVNQQYLLSTYCLQRTIIGMVIVPKETDNIHAEISQIKVHQTLVFSVCV